MKTGKKNDPDRSGQVQPKIRKGGLVEWLLACPVKGFLDQADFDWLRTETTGDLTSRLDAEDAERLRLNRKRRKRV
jgi:hypothetical protein